MKLVVDSNQLTSPTLQAFFERSPSNVAVLTDFVAMEAYKGAVPSGILKSMDIVSRFPNQILVLKGSAKVCQLRGRASGLQRRLIDEDQTRGFKAYVRDLQKARLGDMDLQRRIESLSQDANEHLSAMLSEVEDMRSSLRALGEEYSKEERTILRQRKLVPAPLARKIVRTLAEISENMFEGGRIPSHAELPNTFKFRAAVACYLMAMHRHAKGALSGIKSEKLRNDMVDMMVVAYGTFFDGVLSTDGNLNEMFEETGRLLMALGAEVPCARLISKRARSMSEF